MESIAGLVSATSDPTLVDKLTQLLIHCTNDASRWVNEAACKEIGPFIVALSGKEI